MEGMEKIFSREAPVGDTKAIFNIWRAVIWNKRFVHALIQQFFLSTFSALDIVVCPREAEMRKTESRQW